MTSQRLENKGALAVSLAAPMIWGSTYLVTGSVLPAASPLIETFLRSAPAAAAALCLPGIRARADIRKVTILGVLNFAIAYVGLFTAIKHLPGGLAATLIATQPLVTVLLYWMVAHHPPARRQVLAGLAGLGGVCLLVSGRLDGGQVLGVVAALICVTSQGLGAVLIKHWSPHFDSVSSLGWQLLVAAIVVAPFAALEAPRVHWQPSLIAGVLYISVLGTTACSVLWYRTVHRLAPARASLLLLMVPLVALVLDAVFRGARLSGAESAGVVVVLGSVIFGTRRGRRARTYPELAAVRAEAAVPTHA